MAKADFQGILSNCGWSSQSLNQLHVEKEIRMSSVSSTDLFRIQMKLVMKVGNTLMKINNRTLRILNNQIGNMRMIDAAIVTKALLRKENSQCYYGKWKGQWTTYQTPEPPCHLLGSSWRQLIPHKGKSLGWHSVIVTWMQFGFLKAFKKWIFIISEFYFFHNMNTSKQKQRTKQSIRSIRK